MHYVAPAAAGANLAKGLAPNDGAGPEPNLPVPVPVPVVPVPVLVAAAAGVELAISPLPLSLPLPIDGNLGVLLPLRVEIKQQSSIFQSIKYQINKSPTKE